MSNQLNIKGFICSYLPDEISKKIDYETITLIDKEQTKRDYIKNYSDLIISAKIDNVDSEIYLLLEHKSKKDRFVLLKIIRYCLSVWESNIRNNEKLRAIILLVFYPGKDKWELSQTFNYLTS